MVEQKTGAAGAQVHAEPAVADIVHLNRAILECAGEGIYGLDLNGVTTFANPAATRMTGWPLAELLGKSQHATIHHSRPDGSHYPRETCPIYAALRDGEVHHKDDEVFWRKNGTSFPVAYTSTPLRKDGKLVGAVVVFRDITDRKNRERWDRNYKEVLELVAKGVPLRLSLDTLIAAVEEQQDGLSVSIVPRLPAEDPAGALHPHGEAETHICWSRPIVSPAGEVFGSFNAYLTGTAELQPNVPEVLETACGLARIAVEHRNLLDHLAHQSTHDILTGLANRRLYEDRLEQALRQANAAQRRVAVYILDLDRFKEVNDAYGHAVGDSFLRQAANRILSVLSEGDTLARIGGDEFGVIIPEISDPCEASAAANRIREAVRAPIIIDGHEFFASLSVGFSLFPDHGHDSAALQKKADQAMYRAKAKGGNRFEIFDPAAGELAAEAVQMEVCLRKALENNWFRLEYQPQFEPAGKVIGMEALLRLHVPGQRVIPPGEFIPAAEDTGLIVPIGAWVLREACRQGVEWRERGYAPVSIAVNVSARQFSGSDFAGSVAATLAETGFPPALLDLELTESCLLTGADDPIRQLRQIERLGVRISVDDFGTGYSCLSRLHQLPVSTIKIDKQFIDRITTSAGGLDIVEAIVSLAGQLGFRAIAEGVETYEQLAALRRLGPVLVQGFLLGRPEHPDAAARRLERALPNSPGWFPFDGMLTGQAAQQ